MQFIRCHDAQHYTQRNDSEHDNEYCNTQNSIVMCVVMLCIVTTYLAFPIYFCGIHICIKCKQDTHLKCYEISVLVPLVASLADKLDPKSHFTVTKEFMM